MGNARIGIDVGTRWIKGVELGRRGETLRTAAFPRLGDRLDGDEIARVSSVLRRKGFASSDVTLVCPRESLHRRIVALPAKPDRERDAGIVASTFEAAGDVASAPEPVWWDLTPGTKSEQREVLAFAIDPTDALSWFESFAQAGLNLSGLDIHPSAAVRLADEQTSIVADMAYSHLGLTLSKDRRPVYERHDSELGLRGLLALEGRRLGQATDETETLVLSRGGFEGGTIAGYQSWARLVSESVLALAQYAQRKYPGSPDPSVLLVGGGANNRIARELGEMAGLSCRCAGDAGEAFAGIARAAVRGEAA